MATTKLTGQLINDLGTSLYSGFVNKFYNPAMDIWQRGTSGTITAGTPAYTADGWVVSSTGANVPWAQVAGRYSTSFALKVTGATSVTDVLIKQRIESYLCGQLYPNATMQVTVQAKVYNNTGGSITPTLTVKHPTATDNYTSTVTDVSAVSLQACPNTTLTTVSYTFATASGTLNGLEITFDFGNNFSTSGKSIEISELDIRATPTLSTGLNSSPTLPELRPIGVEMPLCQRHFLSSYNNGVTPGTVTSFGAFSHITEATSSFPTIQCPFPVKMRASPTVTLYSPNSGATAKIYDNQAPGDIATGINFTGGSGFTVYVNAVSTGTTHELRVHFTASAEL